jgi:hypothetical protein
MMKKLVVVLLVLGGVVAFVAGCKPEKEAAAEHPAAEHPEKPAAPRDHPAH